jgi:hypothetical protein
MFENLKRKLQERIERNGVKIPNISYTDKKGKVYTEDIILKRDTLPLIGDWSRIYPPVYENENGELKFNLMNLIFGGKRNFVKLLIILVIVGMVLLAFKEIFNQYGVLKELCEPILSIQP